MNYNENNYMTKQITIKLNEDRFLPLLNELRKISPLVAMDCNSALTGKILILAFFCIKNNCFASP